MAEAPTVKLMLSGDVITMDNFARAIQALNKILREIDKEMSGEITAAWSVQELSKQNPASIATRPELIRDASADNRFRIVQLFDRGIRLILQRAERPRYFNDAALRGARDLADLLGNDVSHISLTTTTNGAPRPSVLLNRHLLANVDDLINPTRSHYGSVEGRLEVISVHNRASFVVYEDLTNRRVICYCNKEDIDNLRGEDLGKRAVVSGIVRTNSKGDAVSVSVKKYRFFTEQRKLPQPDDIAGLMEGVSTSDLLELLREDDAV